MNKAFIKKYGTPLPSIWYHEPSRIAPFFSLRLVPELFFSYRISVKLFMSQFKMQ